MRKIVFSPLMCLLLASCAASRASLSGDSESLRSVIRERVVYKDTLILFPIPSEIGRSVLDDTDTSRLQTSLAESEAFVSGGKLHHTLRNRNDKLQPIYLSVPEKLVQIDNDHHLVRTVTVEVERELTFWQKLFMALGQGAFVAGLVVILWIIIRIVRKFI